MWFQGASGDEMPEQERVLYRYGHGFFLQFPCFERVFCADERTGNYNNVDYDIDAENATLDDESTQKGTKKRKVVKMSR